MIMRGGLRGRVLEFISQLQHLLPACTGGKLAHCSKCLFSPCVKWVIIAFISEVNAVVMRNKLVDLGRALRAMPDTVDVP